MFDHDLTFAMSIFAAIAALVVYINRRAKRTFTPKGKPLNIKKMPGAPAESAEQGSAWEEWNFPRPSTPSHKPSSSSPNDSITEKAVPLEVMPLNEAGVAQPDHGQQRITQAQRHPSGNVASNHSPLHLRIGSRKQLRESIITMTLLGPCRALVPFEHKDDGISYSRW